MLVLAAFGSLFLVTFLLLLCTKRKTKVTSVSYAPRGSVHTDGEAVERSSEESNPVPVQKLVTRNGSETRRPHSSSQTSRELPQLPAIGHDTHSVRTSNTQQSGSLSELSGSGGSPSAIHHSPKGRRLPTPPPEGFPEASEHQISFTVNDEDEEDMYAKVEDGQRNANPVRLKIRTLDINEGSGDSSFYAKVGDVVTDEPDGLYAQVDDQAVQMAMSPASPDIPGTSAADTAMKSPTDVAANINYGAAEYASIDKLRKKSTVKRKAANEEPAAPPIPERNFDADEELGSPDAGEESGDRAEPVEAPAEELQVTEEPSEASQQGPMYDKLCVRESLDHLRHRQEVEQERRHGYVNLPVNSDEMINSADVYAQIEETSPEAVYESLSAAGSADGVFIPPNNSNADDVANPDYSSIQEIGAQQEPATTHQPTVASYPASNARPPRQHHYEQIERVS